MNNTIRILVCALICSAALASCTPGAQPGPSSRNPDPVEVTLPGASTPTPSDVVAGTQAQTDQPLPAGAVNTPAIEVTGSALPTAAPAAAASPTRETAAATQPPTAPAEPLIVNTIVVSEMPFHTGGGPGAMLALPDGIWTGTMFSGLQMWDPQTGNLLKSIPEIEEQLFFDIEDNNDKLWVLASLDDPNRADTLYVLDLPGGDIIKAIPIANEGSYGTAPTQLGSSPGKIWVNFGVVDTETLEYTSLPDGLPSDAHFAYDQEDWMWITGSWCHGCDHGLWLVNASDPSNVRDDQNSGVLGTGVLGQPLALANGRMWLVAAYHSGDTAYFLDAYDLHKTSQPELHIDVTREVYDHGGINIAADNRMVWIEAGGMLHAYDSQTGQKTGQLKVGEYIESMGFDGASLWVLASDTGLVQVALPWAP